MRLWTVALPFRQQKIMGPSLLRPQRRGKPWRNAHEATQDLADLTEVQARVEVLHEVERVALGSAGSYS
jgi:hypothetical protein